jgi:hypothetical protein
VIQRWHRKASDAELDAFCLAIDDAARRAQREKTAYACLGVAVSRADVDATQRRRVARWVRNMPSELRECSAGTYLTLTNPMHRGVMSALRWLIPEMKDVFVADSIDAALSGALAALAKRDARVPGTVAEILRYIG